jgi:hypothetical protein
MRASKSLPRNFASAQAFLPDDKEIIQFLKFGYYKPIDNNWRLWQDELSNKVSFVGDEEKSISFEPASSLGNSQDLYFKAPPELIIEKSIWGSLIICEENSALFWLLGKDYRLRVIRWSKCRYQDMVYPISFVESHWRCIIKQMNDDAAIRYTYNLAKNNWWGNLPFDKKTMLAIKKENKKMFNMIWSNI